MKDEDIKRIAKLADDLENFIVRVYADAKLRGAFGPGLDGPKQAGPCIITGVGRDGEEVLENINYCPFCGKRLAK